MRHLIPQRAQRNRLPAQMLVIHARKVSFGELNYNLIQIVILQISLVAIWRTQVVFVALSLVEKRPHCSVYHRWDCQIDIRSSDMDGQDRYTTLRCRNR